MNIKRVFIDYNKDPYRKSYLQTFYEALRCMMKEKELPSYYFKHLLFKKNFQNYLDFIGHRKSFRIRREILKPNDILDDKILYQKFIQKNNIPGPICLACVVKNYFVINNSSDIMLNDSSEKLTTSEQLVSLLQELLGKCTSTDSIFIKPSGGIGGGGTYKINQKSFTNPSYINKLFADFQKNNYIIQEAVVQHETMNRLNPSSLNTVRIHSYRKPNGEFGIASALSRMGFGGSHVDNITAGGIFVPVDLNKGSLEKYGYTFLAKGGRSYTTHPDNHTVFEGFKLPYFSQALELARQAASFFENKLIGWDVAITVNGPILIEGNHNPHLMMAQTACGGFKSHPIYKEILKDYL